MPPRATFRDVFAVREFRFLWSSVVLSTVGDRLALVALTLLVYDRTGSPLLAALVYAAGYLPWVIGGLFLAGVADRRPRRSVMVFCDAIRAVLVAVTLIRRLPLASRAPASRELAPRTARVPSCSPSGQPQTARSDSGVGAQAAHLGREFGGSLVGDPVVAAQPPVHDFLFVAGDQAIGLQPVQGRVQGARTEPDPAVGDPRDIGHDPVTVLGPRGQRGQDEERRLLHGLLAHRTCICR